MHTSVLSRSSSSFSHFAGLPPSLSPFIPPSLPPTRAQVFDCSNDPATDAPLGLSTFACSYADGQGSNFRIGVCNGNIVIDGSALYVAFTMDRK